MASTLSKTNNLIELKQHDFSGGINLHDDAAHIKANQLADMRNWSIDETGILTKRCGSVVRSNFAGMPKALYRAKLEGDKHLFVFAGDTLSAIRNEEAPVTVETGLTSETMGFTAYQGRLYYAAGDKLRSYETDGTKITFTGATPLMWLAVHNNRLWASNGQSGIYYTEIQTKWRIEWKLDGSGTWILDYAVPPTLLYMPVDDQNGEVMNGLLSYGGSLLIAMSHSLHNLYGWGSEDFTRRKEITGLGCIAPGSLTVGDGLIFFLSKEGVVWIRDGAAQNISEPIEPLLKQLTLEERAKVSAFSYDHKYYIAIPATTGDGGYSLLCEYDVQGSQSKGTPVWTVHTNLGGKAMTACDLDGDNGKLYALQPGTGDTSNLVEIFAPNTTTDDGEPIAAYAETRWLCDGQNSAWFDFRELFLEADFPTGGTMRIDWTVKQGSETKTGYFNVTKAGRVSLPVTAQGTDMKLKFSVNDALTWKLRGYTVVAVQRRVNR